MDILQQMLKRAQANPQRIVLPEGGVSELCWGGSARPWSLKAQSVQSLAATVSHEAILGLF